MADKRHKINVQQVNVESTLSKYTAKSVQNSVCARLTHVSYEDVKIFDYFLGLDLKSPINIKPVLKTKS